jgi:hypothetical protein
VSARTIFFACIFLSAGDQPAAMPHSPGKTCADAGQIVALRGDPALDRGAQNQIIGAQSQDCVQLVR